MALQELPEVCGRCGVPLVPLPHACDDAAVSAFFHERPFARRLFEAVCRIVVDVGGPTTLAATKSRVSIVGMTRFLWIHEAGLQDIHVGFILDRDVSSSRVRSGHRGNQWSHHVKLSSMDDLDGEFVSWVRAAVAYDASKG